jgi:hypothetical protein
MKQRYFLALFSIFLIQGCVQERARTAAVTNENTVHTTPDAVKEAAKPFALMEMFTSEGCMNCPAAYPVVDDVVKEYSKNGQNVILLDYHVDYWNRGGWTDPYSNHAFTNRQMNYARALQNSGLYTPQMIVNGKSEFVASDAVQEQTAVGKALTLQPDYLLKTALTPSAAKDSVILHYSVSPVPLGSTIYVALVQDKATTEVKGGENKGKTLTHYNIVRAFTSRTVQANSGDVLVPLVKPRGNDDAHFSVVAFIQQPDMQVISASRQDIADGLVNKPAQDNKE